MRRCHGGGVEKEGYGKRGRWQRVEGANGRVKVCSSLSIRSTSQKDKTKVFKDKNDVSISLF